MSNLDLATIDPAALASCTGGATQAELKQLAQQYCPRTYQQNKNATITRPLAERCLDEAGLGMFKSRLDAYFPKR